MQDGRLRSIVPMFGGATNYVDTLDAILAYVRNEQPTTDEFVGWHQSAFQNVSSRASIMRRVRYLGNVGFVRQESGVWSLGPAGEEYLGDQTTETLLDIMCSRNVGLRSLLYALSAGPMTIEEISDQQLDTHPELGWTRGETDMAKQRANWLRSMGLVEKSGDEYRLTDEGYRFVDSAVEDWADTAWTTSDSPAEHAAGTYETTVQARSVDPEFRATVLSQYDRTCPVSEVDHAGLLDVAHVLSWSDYPDHRGDLQNVLPLSKTHHAAFDRDLFTIDREYHLRVNPMFETESAILQQTLIEQAGERLPLGTNSVDPDYLAEHNESLAWL